MGGLTIWWRVRRLAPRQQRYQERHRYVAGLWRLQGIIVVWLTLVAVAAYGQEPSQRLTLTPSLSLGERYDDNIFATQTNKQHDFITVLSPGIRAQYSPRRRPWGRNLISTIALILNFLPTIRARITLATACH